MHVPRANARRMPWRNGGGQTEELVLWPAGSSLDSADFRWRLSIAEVHESGSFASFPRCERILVVVEGAGLILTHEDAAPRARLRPLEPYRFSGHWRTDCELADGPVRAFNLFLHPDIRSAVQAVRIGPRQLREALEADQVLLHAARGVAIVRLSDEEDPIELDCGDTLVISGFEPAAELDVQGRTEDCTLLLAHIDG